MSVSRFSLCVLIVLSASLASAASPTLANILPRGAQRGTEAKLVFTGNNLGDAQEVLVHYAGIFVKEMKVANPTTLSVTVAIAPDCRLGEHAFRVRTATGLSDLRTFWVGALPSVDEVEPNNEFEKPQSITLNSTVHGIMQSEDVDYFAIECKKGQRLSVEVEGMRLGNTFWDPFVAILDAKRFELATNDDSPLLGQDAGCCVIVPADGKYLVMLRESSYGGNAASYYRLHVGTFPRPTAVIPSGGKPGEELEVRFLGDPSGEIKQRVKLPAAAPSHFRLHCETPEGVSPTGFKFRLVDLPHVVESGPNNAPSTPFAITVPGAVHGVIGKPGEVDYYKFPAKKGQAFDVRCYARQAGSPLDPVVHVGVLNGAYIAGNDDTIGPDSSLRFVAPDDKEIVVWVHDHLLKGGADFFYRLEITTPAPSARLCLQKADLSNVLNQERQAIQVPRGGRFGTLLISLREDLSGPLTMGLDKLPAGVRMDAEAMDPGQGIVPVVFEAKPDAVVGGHLTELMVKHAADPNVVIRKENWQDIPFVLGQNQTIFSRHVADRVAVAVTAECPYSIEVIEPKVPIVQNGSYNLRVVAKRAAGFTGPINVHPLWQPPGVSFVPAATIVAGANETTLAMNAAGNAQVRKWRTALLAVATVGDGPMWTSSQMFTVEVAPPLVAMTMERPAVEQGAQTQLFCKLTVTAPFEGKAKATILGLPPKVACPDLEFDSNAKELAFPITADKASAVGKHGGIFCRVVLEKNGESIVQAAGGTELRVDAPLPPKVAVTPPPTATPMPMTPAPAPAPPQPPKRLTRLEQLRLEQEEREKADRAKK